MSVTSVHESAVEAAIARARGLTPADEPLVQLARALARQVDAAGPDGPGTRLASTYLMAVRMLAARIGMPPADRTATPLARLRAERDKMRPDPPRGPRRTTKAS